MSITIDCFSVNMISQEIPAYFLHVEQLTLKQFRTCLLHEETVLCPLFTQTSLTMSLALVM